MSLTPADISGIAKLARLELSEDEAETFRHQLSSILKFVDKLAEVKTDDVEPMSHVVPVHNVWRTDEAEPCSPATRDAVVKAFPDKEGELLKVKSVF
ncbi:Asp-tRNA(Asn)/Glu-tRNA(Gln) amidotransferase subunit GatC [Candidatus Uhrbacteria bacterium]|nr:Asp-tRNA(Asn)/Glu-tRNA(Gln) amidotransferase subunit GatC [Candidatus Uhrbacteria bacterium]